MPVPNTQPLNALRKMVPTFPASNRWILKKRLFSGNTRVTRTIQKGDGYYPLLATLTLTSYQSRLVGHFNRRIIYYEKYRMNEFNNALVRHKFERNPLANIHFDVARGEESFQRIVDSTTCRKKRRSGTR